MFFLQSSVTIKYNLGQSHSLLPSVRSNLILHMIATDKDVRHCLD